MSKLVVSHKNIWTHSYVCLVNHIQQMVSDVDVSDVTVLLSLTVFLNTVSETMPNTSDAVPLISKQDSNYTTFISALLALHCNRVTRPLST